MSSTPELREQRFVDYRNLVLATNKAIEGGANIESDRDLTGLRVEQISSEDKQYFSHSGKSVHKVEVINAVVGDTVNPVFAKRFETERAQKEIACIRRCGEEIPTYRLFAGVHADSNVSILLTDVIEDAQPMNKRRVKVGELEEILDLGADVLTRLHSKGIMHNDYGVHNWIISDGRMYVIDFEFAKLTDDGGQLPEKEHVQELESMLDTWIFYYTKVRIKVDENENTVFSNPRVEAIKQRILQKYVEAYKVS